MKMMLGMVVGLVLGGSVIAQKPQRTDQKTEKSVSYSVVLNKNAKQRQSTFRQGNLFTGLVKQEQIFCCPMFELIEPVAAEEILSLNQTPPYDYFIVNALGADF